MFRCKSPGLVHSCPDNPASHFTFTIALMAPNQALLLKDSLPFTQLLPEVAGELWTPVCKHAGGHSKATHPVHVQGVGTVLGCGTPLPQRDGHCIASQHAHNEEQLVILHTIPFNKREIEYVQ